MNLHHTLDCFPEVPDVLARLKSVGFATAILSNVAGAKLGGLIDHIVSVEEVGVFKPHPRVYQHAVDRLDVPARAIAFQSSNAWDAYAASAFGMRVVWCNRYNQRRERLAGAPDAEIRTLAELPALL
ncbi:MAG: HAD-IA family hydrolase [Sphingomonadales bacterium]|nr:HAD-IA family hydrolase [Sphingomonadales bacterium]